MQWFVKEQVEEVATMTDLLTVVERSADNPLLVEEYLAREGSARRTRTRPRHPPPAARPDQSQASRSSQSQASRIAATCR